MYLPLESAGLAWSYLFEKVCSKVRCAVISDVYSVAQWASKLEGAYVTSIMVVKVTDIPVALALLPSRGGKVGMQTDVNC